jgi:hypothetical protein
MADCTSIFLSVPPAGEPRAATLAELEDGLASLPKTGFSEVWVDHGPFPSLCALLNGPQGWLMYLRYDGDAGFSSRNPAYSGSPTSEIDYVLSNGQRDRYPASWAYPRSEVLRAVQTFALTRRVENIVWFNDAGDSASSPNEWVDISE